MRIYYTDTFELPLPKEHRFPMPKYRLLRERISAADWASDCELLIPRPATEAQLLLAHDSTYVERVKSGSLSDSEIRRVGFPWSSGLVERSRRSTGATIEAAISANVDGFSVSLAGGTHHAFSDAGEGFCVFNDTVVAARVLQTEHNVRRVVIIDCDVHQGNGSAHITREDDSIYTYSIHGAKNFPLRKTVSNMDVPLLDGTSDAAYLSAIEETLPRALESAQAEFAFYVAGADPLREDRYGRMELSKLGLASRDEFVFEQCRERGLPVATVMGGGYAPRVEDIVDVHAQTVRLALASCELFGR